MPPQLGILSHVELRDAWKHEAHDFTPWLAQERNLLILGETLGLELELEGTEQGVGPFNADIVCRDTADGSFVLIENQLAKTDHTHLGQILTYAAGLSAVQVIWIASRFTDEHRAALDWLNEHTDDRLRFFGLEIQLWRIGDSLPAPRFNIVSKPNDWVKSGSSRSTGNPEMSETKKLQLEFWTHFREYCLDRDFSFKPIKPLPQVWMSMAVGRTGLGLSAIASSWNNESGSYDSWEIRAEFVVYDTGRFLEPIQAMWADVESELGFELPWQRAEGRQQARAVVARAIQLDHRETWDEAAQWLSGYLDSMHRVLAPRVKDLP